MSWNYQSPWWLPGGNIQTIFAAKVARHFKSELLDWSRQRWSTPDGDFIDVDWLKGHEPSEAAPLLVLFHGLEGSSDSHYSKAFASEVKRKGWSFALPHFRGCSGEVNLAPRAYHSGDHEEIDWILTKFRRQHHGPLYAVGISLGGNALMRWAGEQGHAAAGVIDGIASVCSPLDLTASGHAIDRGFNKWVYARMFLASMKPRAMQKLEQFPGLFDPFALMHVNTLYGFDNVFTAPLHGFKDTDEYWHRASAKPGLSSVRVPALVMNARNDPFIPQDCLPNSSDVSNWVQLWQPQAGGHVGFVSGSFPGNLMDMPNAVVEWLKQAST